MPARALACLPTYEAPRRTKDCRSNKQTLAVDENRKSETLLLRAVLLPKVGACAVLERRIRFSLADSITQPGSGGGQSKRVLLTLCPSSTITVPCFVTMSESTQQIAKRVLQDLDALVAQGKLQCEWAI